MLDPVITRERLQADISTTTAYYPIFKLRELNRRAAVLLIQQGDGLKGIQDTRRIIRAAEQTVKHTGKYAWTLGEKRNGLRKALSFNGIFNIARESLDCFWFFTKFFERHIDALKHRVLTT